MVEIEKPRIVCMDSPDDVSYGKYVVEPHICHFTFTVYNTVHYSTCVFIRNVNCKSFDRLTFNAVNFFINNNRI